MQERILLLQSGGRDSAAAAINLLEAGESVLGITLASNAVKLNKLPRLRALEISQRYKSYSWAMADITEWDRSFKTKILSSISSELPKSCLICALSKMTAIIPTCLKLGIRKIAMGYTEYQSSWAEQTPYAVELQKKHLMRLGIEMILPSLEYKSKAAVENTLIAHELSPNSLENPCCISDSGTQPVPDALIAEAIDAAFKYCQSKSVDIQFVDSVGFTEIPDCP